jgi:hypothetical protein
LAEDARYDAQDYYSQCKRKASRVATEDEEPDLDESQVEEEGK